MNVLLIGSPIALFSCQIYSKVPSTEVTRAQHSGERIEIEFFYVPSFTSKDGGGTWLQAALGDVYLIITYPRKPLSGPGMTCPSVQSFIIMEFT
jgi:hypothetical protein